MISAISTSLFGSNIDMQITKCKNEYEMENKIGNEQECLKVVKMIDGKFFGIIKSDKKLSQALHLAGMILNRKKDYKNASIMFKKSMKYGGLFGRFAQIELGALYYYGYGVSKNYIKAYKLWKDVAMSNGNSEVALAQNNLDFLCKNHSWVCK